MKYYKKTSLAISIAAFAFGTTASSDNSKSNSGAFYVYRRKGTSWAKEAYVKAANANTKEVFNAALAFDSDTLAVTAPDESASQTTVTNGSTAAPIAFQRACIWDESGSQRGDGESAYSKRCLTG